MNRRKFFRKAAAGAALGVTGVAVATAAPVKPHCIIAADFASSSLDKSVATVWMISPDGTRKFLGTLNSWHRPKK